MALIQSGFSLPLSEGRYVDYPTEYLHPVKLPHRNPSDPYAYLGKIRYTGNSWTAKGPTKDIRNLLFGNHMSHTYMAEMARRMVMAESPGGLPSDIDADSLAGKKTLWYEDGEGPDRTQNQIIHDRKVWGGNDDPSTGDFGTSTPKKKKTNKQ